MRRTCTGITAGVAGAVFLSALLAAQQGEAPKSPWKYYPEEVRANAGPGGPAPARDLTGSWAGESSGAGAQRVVGPEDPPPFTPLGKQMFDRNKVMDVNGVTVAETNDPHVRYCDPFGFPRNMTDQIRGMTITSLPNRTFVLLMFGNIWREIWTDGRTLPTNFTRGRDAHDPTYNGYSIGRWEDDYTFIVETTGLAPETWAHEEGLPHSVEARVTERYHRKSRNDLVLTITMEDPRFYTRPFRLGEVHFRWIPNQKFLDFMCVPSSVQRYLKEMGDPAGAPGPASGGAR